MLLAIDIGNTNIVFGVHDGQRWRDHWRLQTIAHRMPDEYAVLFLNLLHEIQLNFADFDQVIISSVVPPLTHDIASLIKKRSKIEPIIVSHQLDLGIEIATFPADKTGADIMVNAVAAYERFQDNCIVVDFGTATTIIAVEKPGKLIGGAIAPGLNTTADALVRHTSQLPKIEYNAPPSIIGNNTIHAMQSGVLIGHVCLIEGLITRIKAELGPAKVIATGGLARLIGSLTDQFDEVDPWLTLTGLRILADRLT